MRTGIEPIGRSPLIFSIITAKPHAIVAAGSVISKAAEAYMIYVGNPAVAVKERVVRGGSSDSQG